MATWIFNNEMLQRHPIYGRCASHLNAVSNRDYPNKNYFNNDIACMDMDAYEKDVQKSSFPDCTTDAVIGICDYDTQQPRNSRLLCVELRMDYKSVSTFFKTDFERKLIHTKDVLGQEVKVEMNSLYVFSDRLEAQAIRWFSRISKEGGTIKYIQPCGVSSFAKIVMSKEDFPYQPQHDEAKIREDFSLCCQKEDWMAFMNFFSRLCLESIGCYRRQYQEYEFLQHLLIDIWSTFRQEHPIFENDDVEFMALNIEDDFGDFLKL